MRVKSVRRAVGKLRASRRGDLVLSTPRRSHSSSRSHSSRLTFAQVSALLAASALVGSSLNAAPAHAQTWIGTTGNWSDATKWLNGTVPVSPASLLTFTQNTSSSYTATNNIAAPFFFNAMNFAGSGTGAITIASSSGNSLATTGANPTISQNGISAATITSDLSLGSSAGTTTIGGSGVGNLTLSGVISGSGGLTINQGGGTLSAGGYIGGGSVVLISSNSNTFSGDVNLVRGNLSIGATFSLGDGNSLNIVNGAQSTLRLATSSLISNNINVQSGPLNLASTSSGNLAGTISGATAINSYGTAITTLSGDNTFNNTSFLLTGGTVNSGTSGGIAIGGLSAIGAGSTISIVKNATLLLDNGTSYNGDRVADSVALNLNNGRFQYNSAGSAFSNSETLGAVNATGFNTISLGTGATNGVNATLNFGALTRTDNAQLFVRGALTGGGASGTTSAVYFAGGLPTVSAPGSSGTGVYTGIVPFFGASTSASSTDPNTFATYNAIDGLVIFTPTNASVMNQVAAGGTLLADANNNLNGSITLPAGVTRINSLAVNGTPTISGTGTLQIYSGAVANFNSTTFSGPTVDFGANTGYFHLGFPVIISGASQITGSNGVVAGSLASGTSYTLSFNNTGGNPFTGGLFVNGNAAVQFNTGDAQLGATGGAIRLNGGTLTYTGTAATSLSAARPINIGAAGGGLSSTSTTAGVVLTVPNNLTGTGDLAKLGAGTVALTGNNAALTGNTIVNAGTLQFNPGGLSSGNLILAGGTLAPLATNTATGPVTVAGTSTLTVGSGLTQTFSGGVNGGGALTKAGAGALAITGAGGYAGALSVTGGTAVLSGAGAIKSPTMTVTGAGSELQLNNAGTANNDRVADGGALTLSGGGQFRLVGNATTVVTETLGVLSLTGTGNIVTVDATGGAATTLSFAGFAPGTGSVLFRGNNLGVPTAARILISGLASGYITGATVDDTVTGTGTVTNGVVEQAYYDAVNGVRRSNASDFTSGPIIQNAAPTNTPTGTNFRILTSTSTVDAANTINSLRFNSGASLNASSGRLTVTSGGILTEAGSPATITGGTIASGTGNAFLFSTNSDLSVSSALSGGSGLSKNGLGTLTLTGAYGVTGGSLSVTQGGLIASGATVNTGAVTLGGTALTVGSLTASTVNVTSGALNASSLNASGALTLTGGSLTTTGAAAIGGGSITGAALTTGAAGLTSSGAITVGTGGALNTPSVAFTGEGGLTVSGTGTTTVNSLSFNNTGSTTVLSTPNSATLTGPVNLSNNVTTSGSVATFAIPTVSNQTVTLSGRVSGGNVNQDVRFDGNSNDTNTWRLTNATNNFVGRVDIYEGGLAVTSDGALGNADNDIRIYSLGATAGGLQFDANNVVLNPQRTIIGFGGAINTNGNNAEIQGAFTDSSSLYKIGAGTLNLSSATGNTYSGTFTASQGTLAVNGVFGSTPFVASGGTIGGTGTTGALTVSANGMIAPGNSIGTLNATSLLFNNGGALSIELGANGVSDVLNLSGALTQGTAGTYSLNFLNAGGLASGNTYTFLRFASTTFNVGAGGPSSPFSLTLPSGYSGVVTSNGTSLSLAVTSVAVPEPGSIAFLLGPGAVGMFAVARNRRRSKKAA